jgi:hypothetical protein
MTYNKVKSHVVKVLKFTTNYNQSPIIDLCWHLKKIQGVYIKNLKMFLKVYFKSSNYEFGSNKRLIP